MLISKDHHRLKRENPDKTGYRHKHGVNECRIMLCAEYVNLPYRFASAQMGPTSCCFPISTLASPDLMDSCDLHIFGK
jgi:hypothetical protein